MWAISQINQNDRVSFLRDARDHALLNGAVLRYKSNSNDNNVGHIPFTAFPSPFPERVYKECLDLHPIVSKLMMRIANDADFINETLGPLCEADTFTRELLAIENTVRREGRAQPIMSCINRADYMLHKVSNSNPISQSDIEARQVEVNAIASAMSGHSHRVRTNQDYLFSKHNISKPDPTMFPTNDSLDLVAIGLIDAFDYYCNRDAHVLVVVEPRSLNFSDQRLIEYAVHHRRKEIRFIRRDFRKLPGKLRIGPNKELILEDTKEIAVVYFRSCFDPSNYEFEGSWATRLLLERSRAIKCPSINFHLSGAKKFQQVLNTREQLERYLTSGEALRLERVYCKIWSIESIDSEGYKLATSTGDSSSTKLVLKPQREGGGHNIFTEDIRPYVEKLEDSKVRAQYILMEYIDGPLEHNLLLHPDDEPETEFSRMDECDQLISELGIYGSIIVDGRSGVLSNKAAGYLVRSKRSGVNEGGVSAGYAGVSNLIALRDYAPADLSAYYAN